MYLDDVTKVLVQDSVSFRNFSDKTQAAIAKIGNGCIIIKFSPEDEPKLDEDENKCMMQSFAFCAWKGRYTVRAYVKACEKEHFLRLAGRSHEEVKAMPEKVGETLQEDKQRKLDGEVNEENTVVIDVRVEDETLTEQELVNETSQLMNDDLTSTSTTTSS